MSVPFCAVVWRFSFGGVVSGTEELEILNKSLISNERHIDRRKRKDRNWSLKPFVNYFFRDVI